MDAHHSLSFTYKHPNRFNWKKEGEDAFGQHGHEGRIFQSGKLHCTGPDVLPNGYNVAVEDSSVDFHRTLTNRPRIHCIRVIGSTERVRILCW